MTILLRRRDGAATPLALDSWTAPATPAERRLLGSLPSPVLDLGCGPGRLVVALGELGIPALGVDASEHAVRHATARGATALLRSIFDTLPGEGRWPAILLLDGNVGIGGSPRALLERVAELMSSDGQVFIETEPPGGVTTAGEARLERGDEVSCWFPWAWVAAGDADRLAASAGLRLAAWHLADHRWIAQLRRA